MSDIKIDVWSGPGQFREESIVGSISEGKKLMRKLFKDKREDVVMYVVDCDKDDSTICYFFNKEGKIKYEKL